MASNELHQFKAESVAQIGILVKEDPEEMSKAWERLFGIGPWRIVEISPKTADGGTVKLFKLALADLGGGELELAQPIEGKTYHKEYVETHGNTGLHHICFPVADVDAEVANFKAQGGEVLAHAPGGFAYVKFAEASGVIIELVPKR